MKYIYLHKLYKMRIDYKELKITKSSETRTWIESITIITHEENETAQNIIIKALETIAAIYSLTIKIQKNGNNTNKPNDKDNNSNSK